MSRRSLRISDGLMDSRCSASFSEGGASWRSTRSMKSARSQQLSSSCSESLLVSTPRKLNAPSLLNSSLHSVASDASLLSSLLDDSSIQDSTLVDSFWGLDHDLEPKEQSTILAERTVIGSDGRCPKHLVQTLSTCRDCDPASDRQEVTACTSSKYTSSSLLAEPGPPEPRDQETSYIYSRDRSRKTCKTRPGVLSLWDRCAGRLLALLALLHHLLQQKRRGVTDVLQLWLDGCVRALTLTWQVCRGLSWRLSQSDGRAARRRGVMSLKESTTDQKDPHPNGSLCAAAGDVCRWLGSQWHHRTTDFLPTRSPLLLLLLLLLLLPLLLLLLSLCWFGPAGLQSVTEWTEVYSLMAPQNPPAGGAVEESREVQLYEEPLYVPPPPAEAPPGEEEQEQQQQQEEEEVSTSSQAAEAERLVQLERAVAALWERVEAGGRRAELRHREVLRLYTELQQQQLLFTQAGEEAQLTELLDRQLEQLRTRLDEERRQWEQARQQDSLQQQSQTSRLEQLELQLQALTSRAEDVRRRRDDAAIVSPSSATLPAAVSVGVDRQSHDALLAEVERLEGALEDVRRDVQSLSGCRDDCRRLDRVQQTISDQVSALVREEVRTLVYGNQLAMRGGASEDAVAPPESLLLWLSQQYVSGADLQEALASLERSILHDVRLQLERHRGEEAAGEAPLHAAGAAVSREDVHEVVQNALRLFAQDRTGLADYALESGGGSILSTRCSETYETKAALLSLFGVPLWYFSQSPRVVIQPDVHPGNCWAFRGSRGFLVIRLSMRILPTAFSLEHIPKALAPSGALHSAPRDFSVYGLDDEAQERGRLLGSYTYEEDGEAVQTFAVTEEADQTFQVIEVQVSSNWGHLEYTCMYRFRVHGTPADV